MASDLTFKVTRKNPQLIPLAKPTPHVFKPLSDIDDQEGLRFQIPIIQFYPKNPSMEGKDPVKIIHDAIAKALVFYYPFAGRLREAAARKLIVECTGEGVMFIEADADITLKEFGDNLQPPFPCLDELLYDVPGSGEVLNCPLLLIQNYNMEESQNIENLQIVPFGYVFPTESTPPVSLEGAPDPDFVFLGVSYEPRYRKTYTRRRAKKGGPGTSCVGKKKLKNNSAMKKAVDEFVSGLNERGSMVDKAKKRNPSTNDVLEVEPLNMVPPFPAFEDGEA